MAPSSQPEFVLGRLASELLLELFERTLSTLVVVALFSSCGPVAERIPGTRDLVFDPVPRERSCRAVPTLCIGTAFGSFTERVASPLRAAFDFAVGQLVTQLGVLSRENVDGAGQTVAFLADRGGIAELAGTSVYWA